MNLRAAFASTGEYVDQHFAAARYFEIYDISGSEHSHVETRRAEAKCRGNCEGGFDHLLEILNDCDAVFVSRIGQSAAAFMIGHGKRVFEAAGMVEEIIAELKKGNLLEEPACAVK
jgi:predicted Fe-Mo cluster-binding NifX family protein